MKLRVYNNTLNPELWDENMKLKPEVREVLLKVAEDFYKSTELKGDLIDVLLLGSSANYNWTPQSDIDLHLLIDVSQEKMHPDHTRKFLDSLAFKWNSQHSIKIKSHDVEIYLQDIGEINKSVGVYSLLTDAWLREPEKERVELDKEDIKRKFQRIKHKIEKTIETEDTEKLKDVMSDIRKFRQVGLDKAGEYSSENVVFKALRYSGLLKKLKDSINRFYDKQVSINEKEIVKI